MWMWVKAKNAQINAQYARVGNSREYRWKKEEVGVWGRDDLNPDLALFVYRSQNEKKIACTYMHMT